MKITYLLPDDISRDVEVAVGTNLMETAVTNGIPGVIGECNGSAACATCHVVLAPEVFGRLGAIPEHEDDMLEFAQSPREPGSRLGCQVQLEVWMAGMIVRVAGA